MTNGSRVLRVARITFLVAGTILLLLVLARDSVASLHRARGSSDAPAIRDGEVFLVNRLAYDVRLPVTGRILARRAEPKRGDLVLFSMPGSGALATKRVAGCPGDTVEVVEAKSPVNGTATRVEVPPDHYFLLGDDRARSLDSRHFGPVHRRAVLGRVMVRSRTR